MPARDHKSQQRLWQEKHAKYGFGADGTVIQDGETPGSDNGLGVPSGGPGEGRPGAVTKQDGTDLR